MISYSYFKEKIKDVKIKDLFAIFPMLTAKIVSPLYKNKYKDSWLICEEPFEARDNGYLFFKYVCEKHPEVSSFYAIKSKSVDYSKVKNIGNVVEHGSVKHWILYFVGRYNISSQKGGKPNAALCSFFELNGLFKPHNVFLQHGITINKVEWLFANKSKFDYFITSTVDEYKYILDNFGYPEKSIVMTGMPRFDALHNVEIKKNRILIMPTWRYWFNLQSKKTEESEEKFEESEYYMRWSEVLISPKLNELILEQGLEVIFYPHRNMQDKVSFFKQLNSKVIIADWKEYDIQELIHSSAMMITDYSSVFFDMVYMKRPVIFYQFDEKKFRANQYDEGYFNYHNTPFAQWCDNSKNVVFYIEEMLKNNFEISEQYKIEHSRIFRYYDNLNSERIFTILNF